MSSLLLSGFDISSFCSSARNVLSFIGWILTVFKVAVPLLIIGYGIFDFGQAVVGSKDDDIKKSTKRLMYRALAGIIIFFIPSIVLWLFSLINDYNNAAGTFDLCKTCILEPWSNRCQ